MANTFINRKVTLTSSYVALEVERTVASVVIENPSGNSTLYIKGDNGTDDVPWIVGKWDRFQQIDLATVFVKGTPGDAIIITGFSGSE